MDWVFLGCSVVLVGGRGKFPEYSFVVYWMGYTVVFFHNNNKKKKQTFWITDARYATPVGVL